MESADRLIICTHLLYRAVRDMGLIRKLERFQPRSQTLFPRPLVGRETLVEAGHAPTCNTNFSTRVESTKSLCRSQLKRKKGDCWTVLLKASHCSDEIYFYDIQHNVFTRKSAGALFKFSCLRLTALKLNVLAFITAMCGV